MIVSDLGALFEELDRLPPRLIRPRIDVEAVRLLQIGEVRIDGYEPGSQRLSATITAPQGGTATVVAVHRAVTPAALDSLAAALSGERGTPRYLSGIVRRTHHGLAVSPIAVVVGDTVVVPDLADGDGAAALTARDASYASPPLIAAIDGALGVLAQVARPSVSRLSRDQRSPARIQPQ
jgi:hypothetical protein